MTIPLQMVTITSWSGRRIVPALAGVSSGCAWFPSAGAALGLAVLFATYHPLLVESHYSVLLCLLMLGDFTALLRAFVRAATIVDGLEGYPFYPALDGPRGVR